MVWIVVILALMIPLIAVVLDSSLGRAMAGRLERQNAREDATQLGSRVAALEAEVDRLSHDVERNREESEFLRHLLEDKPESGPALPPGDGEA